MLLPIRNPWAKGSYLIGITILFLIGLAALVGWTQEIPSLVQAIAGLPFLGGNTALCFIAFAIAFSGLQFGRRGALLFAIVPAIFGALAVAQFLDGRNLGIDEWMFNHSMDPGTHPGRMSPVLAGGMFLGAIAMLVLFPMRTLRNRGFLLALTGSIVAAAGFAALVGYVTQLPAAYSWEFQTPMALLDAVGLLAVGVSLVLIAAGTDEPGQPAFTWLPYTVAIGALSLTLIFWLALQRREADFRAARLRLAANNLAIALGATAR